MAHITIIAPSGPPQSVEVFVASSTSLYISWAPPIPGELNGEIVGYTVTVGVEGRKRLSPLYHFLPGASTSNFTLEGLRPFTNFTITVSASTQVGIGPPSPPQTVLTSEDGMSEHHNVHCLL